jgi:hypothetical protein
MKLLFNAELIMNESLLNRASDFTFAQLKLLDGDITRLATPLQTVAVIYSIQLKVLSTMEDLSIFMNLISKEHQNIPFLSKFTAELVLKAPHLALKNLLRCFLLRSRIYMNQSGSNGWI